MGSNETKRLRFLPRPSLGAAVSSAFPLALSPRGLWAAGWPPRPLPLPGEGPQGPPVRPGGLRGHPGGCREPPGAPQGPSGAQPLPISLRDFCP